MLTPGWRQSGTPEIGRSAEEASDSLVLETRAMEFRADKIGYALPACSACMTILPCYAQSDHNGKTPVTYVGYDTGSFYDDA